MHFLFHSSKNKISIFYLVLLFLPLPGGPWGPCDPGFPGAPGTPARPVSPYNNSHIEY